MLAKFQEDATLNKQMADKMPSLTKCPQRYFVNEVDVNLLFRPIVS